MQHQPFHLVARVLHSAALALSVASCHTSRCCLCWRGLRGCSAAVRFLRSVSVCDGLPYEGVYLRVGLLVEPPYGYAVLVDDEQAVEVPRDVARVHLLEVREHGMSVGAVHVGLLQQREGGVKGVDGEAARAGVAREEERRRTSMRGSDRSRARAWRGGAVRRCCAVCGCCWCDSLMSCGPPGSCPPNWLQGKPTTVKPRLAYFCCSSSRNWYPHLVCHTEEESTAAARQ